MVPFRIAFDTFSSRPPFTYGGVFEYTRQMLAHFRLLAPACGADVTAFIGQNYGGRLLEGLSESDSFHMQVAKGISHSHQWRYGGFGLAARRAGADVAFFPAPDVLPSLNFGVPSIVTLHDVAYTKTAFFSKFKNWRLLQLQRAIAAGSSLVLTNSECSRADIIEHFRLAPEKVRVIYHAFNHRLYTAAPVEQEARLKVAAQFGLLRPYIVHHGTLQPRKNLVRLVEAYRQMMDSHPGTDFDLVLAGNSGWLYEPILAAAEKVRPPGRVIFTGGVDENELSVILKGAALAVVPSLYEGFCVPMLEAMACGVPTIVADNSCLPEVSGGVLRYFRAESVDEIAQTMYDVLQSPSEQQRLRTAGLERVAGFTWERCARETLQAMKQVAEIARAAK